MSGAGRRMHPLTVGELDEWVAGSGRRQSGVTERIAASRPTAVRADDRWGFCGVVAGTAHQRLGLLLLGPVESPVEVPCESQSRPSLRGGRAMIAGVFVDPGQRGQGIGRHLVQAAAAELVRREVVAIDAVARAEELPAAFLQAVGFRLVSAGPGERRYRMDLTTTVRRRPDLAAAWQRLSGLVPAGLPTPLPPPQPAGFEPSRRSASPVATSGG